MVGAKVLWENLTGGTTKVVKNFKNEMEKAVVIKPETPKKVLIVHRPTA
jgi:hypothetical protein